MGLIALFPIDIKLKFLEIKMFFKKIQWLILALVAFISGIIVTVQWIGTDYGMQLYDIIKRPEVIEKVVQIEVLKPIIISDDLQIQMINQEYRDALLKISSIHYDGNSTKKKHESMVRDAMKALSFPGVFIKKEVE